MKTSIATITLAGLSPYSQSRAHEEPKLDKELADAYDKRTWRFKLSTGVRDGKKVVVIPAHGMHQCIAAAAKYSKRQIPGQGKATWTAKFTSGIAILEDVSLGTDPESVPHIDIYANADGIRGSGKRVMRRFPVINEWRATFDVYVLDSIITQDVFTEMLEIAGMFIGIGRFRPEKGGTNGRFAIEAMEWADNRPLTTRAA